MPDRPDAPRLFEVPMDEDQSRPRSQRGTAMLGGVSQFRAACELLERGYKVAVPLVDDDGVDLVVDYRWRVQVKGSGRSEGGAAYKFGLHHSGGSRRRAGMESPGGRRHPVFAADFFICHARPINAWWVIPQEWLLMAGFTQRHTAFSLSADPGYRTQYSQIAVDCRDAWHLLRDFEEDEE